MKHPAINLTLLRSKLQTKDEGHGGSQARSRLRRQDSRETRQGLSCVPAHHDPVDLAFWVMSVSPKVSIFQSGVETKNVKMSMNPFCEIAVEEALRIRESGGAAEVVAVTVGPPQFVETLRTGLAMGADRGIHVDCGEGGGGLGPLGVAKVLRALVELEKPGLLILGKQV